MNVVMGNAPAIGDALLASPQVLYILYTHSGNFPVKMCSDKKYKTLTLSAFIQLLQVRKITFTGSTAVGKKLMAGAAGTVKKVKI